MKLDNWLAQRAQTSPDRTALVADGSRTSFAELEAEATWVARRLAAQGARRGATVALIMPPGREMVVLVHAVLKLGDAGELTQTEADLPLLGEHDMDDVHCRILTGGSSGAPRAIGLTYGNHLWSAVGSAFNIGVQPDDCWLCCLPLSHISGLSIVMRSVIYGTAVGLHEGFDVDRVAETLDRGDASVA